jgi:moderate conductance mechanosensitive channel
VGRAVLFVVYLAVAALTLAPHPALAQAPDGERITVTLPAGLDAETRAEVMAALGEAGAVAAAPRPAPPLDWQQRYAERLDSAVAGLGPLGSRLAGWWQRAGGLGGFTLILLCLAAGLAAAAVITRVPTSDAAASGRALPGFRLRLRGASLVLARDAGAIVAFLLVSFALALVVLPVSPPAARMSFAGFANHLFFSLALIAVAHIIANPASPAARLAPLGDDEARRVWRATLAALVVLAPLSCFRALVVHVAARETDAALTVVAIELAATLVRVWLFWTLRAPVRGLIEHSFGAGRGRAQPAFVGWFARSWHGLYIALALTHLVVVVLARLEGLDLGSAAGYAFAGLVLLPFVLGGVAAWFDDRPAAEAGAGAGLAGGAKALVQGAVAVTGVIFILRAWGIDPFSGTEGGLEDHLAAAVLQAGAALVVGWAVWCGVKIVLDRYAPEAGEAELEEEGFGKTGSRIDTLLPLIRSTALVVIATISLLTALGALGANITALLAGAGVAGLALGFGAQTLVKDVITGVFYLIEDAFRVGEYLVTAEGKGVVEKISLRSVRLRHHRGPVYTIPFGAMGTVQNHSRDWVKVKLLIRVPFETDIEKVRKLIKKVGIAMQEEPELGEHIIQPVKSQGVLEVDDSAMIIGVKFICKPGEQFVIRREAYARIQKAFAENDIEFAPKRVIVESDTAELARARAGAAASAVAQTADADAVP